MRKNIKYLVSKMCLEIRSGLRELILLLTLGTSLNQPAPHLFKFMYSVQHEWPHQMKIKQLNSKILSPNDWENLSLSINYIQTYLKTTWLSLRLTS